MSETARIPDDNGLATGRFARPPLAVVRDAPETITRNEPNVGRTAMIGYAAGFIISVVVITTVGTIVGMGFGASLGLGAFVGVWGGGGFGFMMGGTIPLARYLDDQSHQARGAHLPPPRIATGPVLDASEAHHEPH